MKTTSLVLSKRNEAKKEVYYQGNNGSIDIELIFTRPKNDGQSYPETLTVQVSDLVKGLKKSG